MPPKHFSTWTPGDSDRFDRRKAAHLLRRAGFGAAPEEVSEAVDLGMEGAVDRLFAEGDDQEKAFGLVFDAVRDGFLDFDDADHLRAWWLYRMARTKCPLREKLTLFWHGHFASSLAKVEDAYLMHLQIETLRRLALGNVRDMVLAMAQDPAMLVWLDGESSTKAHPNENFARELMELFTCGIGHYTEADVQEAARAFTGWHREGAQFVFHPDDHDDGPKRFLGKSGRFDGGDVIAILMQQPATPRFLAAKLLRFFAAPEPAADVLDEAAEVLDRTQLDIKWFLRDLFTSRYFYSAACRRSRISSPAEHVVGAVRTLRPRWAASNFSGHLGEMGQVLLAPPNVKGWDGERAWINSTTWAARTAFAKEIAELASDHPFGAALDVHRLVPAEEKDPVRIVDHLADFLLDGDLPDPTRRAISEGLIAADDGPQPARFRDDDEFRNSKLREAIATILGLPEAQAY